MAKPNRALDTVARAILRMNGLSAEEMRRRERAAKPAKPMPKPAASKPSAAKVPAPPPRPAPGSTKVVGQTSLMGANGKPRDFRKPAQAANRPPTIDRPVQGPAAPQRSAPARPPVPGQGDLFKGGAIVRSPGGAVTRSPGGAITRQTPPATQRALPGASTPRALPGGRGGADTVRGSGVRTGRPGPVRPALPFAGTTGGGLARDLAKVAGKPGPGAVFGALGTSAAIGQTIRNLTKPGDNLVEDIKNIGTAIYNSTTPAGSTRKRYGGTSPQAQALNKSVDAKNKEAWARQNQDNRPPTPRPSGSGGTRAGSSGGSSGGSGSRSGGSGSSGGYSAPMPSAVTSGSSSSSSRSTPPASRPVESQKSAPATSSNGTPTSSGGTDKERRMAQWAMANPKLAEALGKRNNERGTSKSSNPQMDDFRARMKEREDKAKLEEAEKKKTSSLSSSLSNTTIELPASQAAKAGTMTQEELKKRNQLAYGSQ